MRANGHPNCRKGTPQKVFNGTGVQNASDFRHIRRRISQTVQDRTTSTVLLLLLVQKLSLIHI